MQLMQHVAERTTKGKIPRHPKRRAAIGWETSRRLSGAPTEKIPSKGHSCLTVYSHDTCTLSSLQPVNSSSVLPLGLPFLAARCLRCGTGKSHGGESDIE